MIREFRPTDMNRIIRLAREHEQESGVQSILPIDDVYFTNAVRDALIDVNHKLFVAETNGEVVGYALIGVTQKIWNPTMYGDVFFFYIHQSIRNKYLADSLWNQCVIWFKEQGCRFMECSVALFDNNFQGVDNYIERASKYFEHKGASHMGNHFVLNLEE